MIDLVVSGATGRMGRALGRMIADADDLQALGGIAPDGPDEAGELGYPTLVDGGDPNADRLIRDAHAVLDFSAPEYLDELLDRHADALAGRAVLVGTTGLDTTLEDRLAALSEDAAVLVAANFSLGVNLLLGLVEEAARALPAEGYDIEIVEAHHRDKEDAPSGTAEALGRAAARGRATDLDAVRVDGRSGRPGARPTGEIGFHAVRGGGEPGEHVVHLLGDLERITLAHRAGSRELFAHGALVAARWLVGRGPGRYTMRDVLGL